MVPQTQGKTQSFPEKQLLDYEHVPVPRHISTTWMHIAFIFLGIVIAVPGFLLGGSLGTALPLKEVIIAVYGGAAVLTVIGLLTGIIGAQTKQSTAQILTSSFGVYGARFLSVVLGLTLFGWFSINTELFAQSLHYIIAMLTGIDIHLVWLTLFGGLTMTTTAVIGFRGIDKLSIIAVPPLAILIGVSVVLIMHGHSLAELFSIVPQGTPMTLGTALSVVISVFIVGATINPDVTRYARNSYHAAGAVLIGFLFGFPTVLLIGSLLAKATGSGDLVTMLAFMGFGVTAFLVLLLATWTTNDNNLYSSSLDFSHLFVHIPRWKLCLGAGVVSTIIAMVGIIDRFIPFLSLLAMLIPPIVGVYITDFFLMRKRYAARAPRVAVCAVRYTSLFAWLCGVVISFLTTPVGQLGLGFFTLTTVPALDAMLVAMVMQLFVVVTAGRFASHPV